MSASQENPMSTPPTAEQEYYANTARHYDAAYAADSLLTDIPFYVELAKAQHGTVLEVACGTGRVLLPTAQAGVTIDGLDLSSQFLELLRGKLSHEPAEVQARVSLFEGDMRRFSTGKTYDLLTIPFRPLQHLYLIEDQLAAFRCFHAHLKPGGSLAFNVFYPNYARLQEVGVEKLELEWKDPNDPSITVRRSFLRRSVDRINQFSDGEFIFRSYRGSQLVLEERSSLRMGYYTYPQIRLLLETSGFQVREEYGSFEKEPISVCKEMIFVAVKR